MIYKSMTLKLKRHKNQSFPGLTAQPKILSVEIFFGTSGNSPSLYHLASFDSKVLGRYQTP